MTFANDVKDQEPRSGDDMNIYWWYKSCIYGPHYQSKSQSNFGGNRVVGVGLPCSKL